MVFNQTMLIGDVARLSDLSPATIRYYEELGLLTAPPRSEAGYRHYSDATIEELRFIKKGQGLGFSLEEIGEFLKISRAGEAPCPVPITCSGCPLPQFGTPQSVQCSRPAMAAQAFQNSVEMPL